MKKLLLILILLLPINVYAGDFAVHKNGTHQTYIQRGVPTILEWHHATWDTDDEFNLNTGEFCPKTAGLYDFSIGMNWQRVADGNKLCMGFAINGVQDDYQCIKAGGTKKNGINFSDFFMLNVGDCVSVGVQHNSRNSDIYVRGVYNDTWFKGALIREY